jgi:pyruvate dehydrogenase E2 component (dihydrolipoamide acetyltransferase)
MAKPINMPQIGQDLETGRIIEWQVKEGDEVKKGDIVATVESDKATFEVEAPESGTIIKLLFSPGDEAQVFKPIAYIGSQGETPQAEKEVSTMKKPEESLTDKTRESAKEEALTVVPVSNARLIASPSARRIASENSLILGNITPSGPNNRIVKRDVVEYLHSNPLSQVRATPVARKVASVEGIALDKLQGSGPGGKIQKEDVISSIESGPLRGGDIKSKVILPSAEDKVILFDKTRKRIAERLTYSKQTIPHYYLFADVDVTIT